MCDGWKTSNRAVRSEAVDRIEMYRYSKCNVFKLTFWQDRHVIESFESQSLKSEFLQVTEPSRFLPESHSHSQGPSPLEPPQQ